ncbi:MAG: DUF4357 domain-containing protein [Oscillospiraceae bacterium]|nr:DUF4357 domain-containing protein [Oscillospiraceae bacterium]
MEVYLNRKDGTNATGEYDINTNTLTVYKGSRVSSKVKHSEKFRGAVTIERLRSEHVKNGVAINNVSFTSPSTAANFVTGCSSNGLRVWKDKSGRTLKELTKQHS